MDFKLNRKTALTLFVGAALLLLLANTSSAEIELRDGINVQISESSIDTGDSFDVVISLEDPDDTDDNVDVWVEITADGTIVHEKNYVIDFVEGEDETITINSDNFETEDEGKIWKENLMNYACKDNLQIDVEVSDGVSTESDYDEIDVESSKSSYELFYEMSPSVLTLTDKLTVTVTDEADDEVKDAYVKFTWLDDPDGDDDGVWDINDDKDDDKTDSKGKADFDRFERTFDDDAYGKYQIDVYKAGYCKVTEILELVNRLNISDPTPSPPQAGEQFKVRVLKPDGNPATGLYIYVSPGGLRSSVASDGYASFTLPSDGTYSLTAGGSGTAYDETIKTLKVEKKSTLTVSPSPTSANVNEQVKIAVKSDSNGVSGATVYVQREGASEEKLSGATDSNGVITYVPSQAGNYNVRAEKVGYDAASSSFSAKNTFKVSIPDVSNLERGEQVIVTVTDQSGNPVSSAVVSIDGTPISGLTDLSGKYSFVLDNPGTYSLTVKKTGYSDMQRPITTVGRLSVKISQRDITLGDDIKISVVNKEGILTPAQIKVSGPEGTKTQSGSEYTYKPGKVGAYTVRAEGLNYEAGENNFTVNPKQLSFTYSFSDDKLILNVTSGDVAVKQLKLNVEANGEMQSILTDENGVAVLENVQKDINYTITSDSPDYVKKQLTATMNKGIFDSGILVPLMVVLFVVLLLMIFVVVSVALLQRKKKGSKMEYNRPRSGGSRLAP